HYTPQKTGQSHMHTDNQSPVVIYEDADKIVEVRLDTDQETVWLNLQQLADLFGRDKSVISYHLKHTFRDAELDREAVVAKNATTENFLAVRTESRAKKRSSRSPHSTQLGLTIDSPRGANV
ncbi:hypothetical protein RZS08_43600, partial [Arthrospira platensis SPKY1]|nr:hypothetical protein [Arthrospira platensis SPKY1]